MSGFVSLFHKDSSQSLIASFKSADEQKSLINKDSTRYSLVVGIASLPKGESINKVAQAVDENSCGEDSYCVVENDYQSVIAVADGVGGWRKKGIDPSRFSRGLMKSMREILGYADYYMQAKEVLRQSFWGLVEGFTSGKIASPFGSSTVCLISLDRKSGLIEGENLGDSGFMVINMDIREGKVRNEEKFILQRDGLFTLPTIAVVKRSIPQQTRFNAPFQLVIEPNGNISDQTALSQTYVIQTAQMHSNPEPAEALFILASDGLWDNLFEEDIINVISRVNIRMRQMKKEQLHRTHEPCMEHEPRTAHESRISHESSTAHDQRVVNLIAQELVKQARINSERSDYESPFALEARRYGKIHIGGKPDDITVLVAKMQDWSTTNHYKTTQQ